MDRAMHEVPRRATVSAASVLGLVARICRRRMGTLVAVGVVLFAPLAAIEALAIEYVHESDGGLRAWTIGAYLGVSLLMFGSAMCAGLLDTVVGREFGEDDIGWARAVRTLPYRRLIGVDLVQAVVIGTASLLGFLPGLLVFTVTCLAGAVVMIEQASTGVALRRSLELTRHRLGLTFVLVTLPVAVEHQIIHALGVHFELSFLALWALLAVAAVVILVPVVVIEITLTRALRGAHTLPDAP